MKPGDMSTTRPGVTVLLGTATGGTARHAGMLAEGCRRAGLAVVAIGPASAQAGFRAGAASWPDISAPATSGPAASAPANSAPAISGSAASGSAASASAASASAASGPTTSGPAQIPFHLAEISDRPRPVRDLAVLVRLRRLLRQAGPGVVHAHGMRAGAFAAVALAIWPVRRGRPGGADRRPALVVTAHNAPPGGRTGRALFQMLEWICARRADAVLCASPLSLIHI